MSGTDTFAPWFAIKGVAADVLRQWSVTFLGCRRPAPACALLHKRTKGSFSPIGRTSATRTLFGRGVAGEGGSDGGFGCRTDPTFGLIPDVSKAPVGCSSPNSSPRPSSGGVTLE
jgi:hypothetical protein